MKLFVLVCFDHVTDCLYGYLDRFFGIVYHRVFQSQFFSFLIGYDQETGASADSQVACHDKEGCGFHLGSEAAMRFHASHLFISS